MSTTMSADDAALYCLELAKGGHDINCKLLEIARMLLKMDAELKAHNNNRNFNMWWNPDTITYGGAAPLITSHATAVAEPAVLRTRGNSTSNCDDSVISAVNTTTTYANKGYDPNSVMCSTDISNTNKAYIDTATKLHDAIATSGSMDCEQIDNIFNTVYKDIDSQKD